MKARSVLLIVVLSVGAISEARSQDVKHKFECEVTGTAMDGSASTKPFKESFFHERREVKDKDAPKGKPWAISKTELYSNGKKLDTTHVTQGEGYLVFTTVTKAGTGFNQKLLVFTHYIDVASAELDRIVTKIPKETEERTKSRCQKVG